MNAKSNNGERRSNHVKQSSKSIHDFKSMVSAQEGPNEVSDTKSVAKSRYKEPENMPVELPTLEQLENLKKNKKDKTRF